MDARKTAKKHPIDLNEPQARLSLMGGQGVTDLAKDLQRPSEGLAGRVVFHAQVRNISKNDHNIHFKPKVRTFWPE